MHMLRWKKTGRHFKLVLYLASITFLVAHIANTFVAEALLAPLSDYSSERSHTTPLNSQPDSHQFPAQRPSPLARAQETPQQSSQAILVSGIFSLPSAAGRGEGGERMRGGAPPAPPLEVGKKISLLGIVTKLTKDGPAGSAVLEDLATKEQTLYRLHDQVKNVGELAEIAQDRVLFRSGDQEEWLNLAVLAALTSARQMPALPALGRDPAPQPATPATRGAPSKRTINRQELVQELSDVSRIFLHAQPVPYFKDGKFNGFRLDAVNYLGFFGKLGLQSGDVLRNINGMEIRNPSVLMRALEQLKHERRLALDFVRNDTPKTLTYEIR